MTKLTSRERVSRALEKKPVDRVPIFMWFHPETRVLLARHLGIPERVLDEVLGNDVRQTWVNNNYAMEGIIHESDGESHVDSWGIRWERRYGFNQIVEYPLAGASREEVLAYRFPYAYLENLMGPMAALAGESEDYYLGCDVSPSAFEMYWRIRGMEDAIFDFATDTELAASMISKCIDFSIVLAEESMRRFSLDWLWTGDMGAMDPGGFLT
ncbi:MAG: hypothetical protein HN368_19995, partial [Spirochaetales bacterium]|nr:hypothetical protein [Spirochaetales bacterium]